MKEKVRVFLSFEFGKDDKLHHNFYSQAALYSQYEIIDYSLNEPYHPDPLCLSKYINGLAQLSTSPEYVNLTPEEASKKIFEKVVLEDEKNFEIFTLYVQGHLEKRIEALKEDGKGI